MEKGRGREGTGDEMQSSKRKESEVAMLFLSISKSKVWTGA